MNIILTERIAARKPEAAQFLRFGASRFRRANQPRLTMDDLLDNWLIKKQSSLKKTTFSTYYTIVERHIRPALGGIILSELSEEDIHVFLTKTCPESSRLSPSTVRGIAYVLKDILAYGSEFGCADNLSACKSVQKTGKSEINVLTKQEQERLLEIIGDDPKGDDLGVLICLKTGLRVGEICALKWQDISLDAGYLSVSRTVQRIQCPGDGRNKTQLYFGEPKSADSRRRIPLPPSLTEVLRKKQKPGDFFVVSERDSTAMEPRSLQRHFKLMLRDAGIRDLNFHVLRHTFATRCVELGIDVKSLSMILGHSDVSITMNTYVHPSFERLRNMMALVD